MCIHIQIYAVPCISIVTLYVDKKTLYIHPSTLHDSSGFPLAQVTEASPSTSIGLFSQSNLDQILGFWWLLVWVWKTPCMTGYFFFRVVPTIRLPILLKYMCIYNMVIPLVYNITCCRALGSSDWDNCPESKRCWVTIQKQRVQVELIFTW